MSAKVGEIRFDVLHHILAGNVLEADAAAGWQMRESRLEFAEDVEAVFAEKCLELAVDAVAFVQMPDKIQNRIMTVVSGHPRSSK